MTEKRPNVLFMYSDQHSARFMSCSGNTAISTPHMDRLAREGVQLTEAYTPMPLCIPARAALLTGRYGHSTGIMHNSNTRLCREEPTFPQALEAAGYHTVHIGKTHLAQGIHPGAPGFEERLAEMGFAESYGHAGKVFCGVPGPDEPDRDCEYRTYLKAKGVFQKFHEDYVKRHTQLPHYYNAPSVLDEEDFHDMFIGTRTARWIDEYDGDKPFFVWCNWGGPHAPWDAPGRYATMYDPDDVDDPIADDGANLPASIRKRMAKTMREMPAEELKKCKANYYGMINVCDDGIGRMLAALEKKGILDDTLVIYASDHGEMMYNHGLHGKSVFFDDSVKVPCLVRYPRRFAQGLKSAALANTIDLVPTILEIAGAEPLVPMNGTSMVPLLTGVADTYQEATFSEHGAGRGGSEFQVAGDAWKMVREGDWKYAYSPGWDRQILFNVKEDPDELDNLSGDPSHADVEARLHGRILDFMFATEYGPR
ncbi:MAG: DUF1501 domain-containing protein [Spirochaetaceae bacterium]|nr:MAG: DUF1501 domain-containing protein [Spirochaetaceae bacterium]